MSLASLVKLHTTGKLGTESLEVRVKNTFAYVTMSEIKLNISGTIAIPAEYFTMTNWSDKM